MYVYIMFSFYFYSISLYWFFFFFSSRRRHTRCSRDWSSDVCSSDLLWFAGRLQQSKIPNFGLLVAFSKAKFQTLVCWSPSAKQNSKLWFAGRPQQDRKSVV